MKSYFMALLLSIFPMMAVAQGFWVKGKVVDAATAEEIPGATCRVYGEGKQDTEVGAGVSSADGEFAIAIDRAGSYKITIQSLGMDDKEIAFVITASHPIASLGTIALTSDATVLDEVTVTARKPVIQSNGERVTYNLEEDPQSQTSTVIEMLRKVPMVTVDGQDNIQVNGQSSFKVYVNGKENPMMSSNAKDVLKAMPASAVKKIEVITEPGAKYDAEGVGGILNIVTEGAAPANGYLATLRAQVSAESTGASVYAISQVGKVTASVNYNYNHSFGNRDMTFEMDRSFSQPDGINHLLGLGSQRHRHDFHNGTFDLSWEPDSLNLFNVSSSLFYGSGNGPMNLRQSLSNASGEKLWSYLLRQNNRWSWGSVTAQASYQHNFGDAGHNIVLSYLYNHGVNHSKTDMQYEEIVNYTVPYPCQLNDVDNPTNEHTLQLDYTNPFDSHHTLEAGAKAIFRRNSSEGITYTGPSFDDLMAETTGNVDMSQYQDVAAIYASYTGTFGKWTTKGGVRYEHTHMGVDFLNHVMPDFSSTLNDIVPNAAISYSLRPASSLRLAYQMRISRPSVEQLNPYHNDSNPLSIEFGNPDLTSERSNSVTLTYTNFMGAVSLNASLSYNRIDNSISRYSYNDGSTQYTTYDNTGNVEKTSFNAFLNFNVIRNLQWGIYGGLSYEDYHFAKMNLKNGGWSGYAMLNLTATLPWDLKGTLYGGCGGGNPGLQSSFGMYKMYSLSLSKSLLKEKRLEVTLNASNFFGPMNMKMDQWTADSYTRMNIKANMWSVGLSVSYKFGGLSQTVKKVSTQIVNDDVEKSSSGGGGVNIQTQQPGN